MTARATDYLDLAADAAAAHLATLPREVPVTAWAVVRPDGTVFELLYSEGDAVSEALLHGYVATPLTGTATIPAGKP